MEFFVIQGIRRRCMFFRISLSNNEKLIVISVYISSNKNILKLFKFLDFILFPFSNLVPLNPSTYFYVVMSISIISFQKKNSDLLINFLKINLHLNTNTQRNIFTTRYQTTIDTVLKRNVTKLKFKIYVNYFSDLDSNQKFF